MTVTWQWGTIRGSETTPTTPILKIGGSLLAMAGWSTALAELIRHVDRPLLIIGGGKVVDGLRAIDHAHPRPPQLMHDLAIKAMTLTARLVADALDLPLVTSAHATTGAVLDVAKWFDETTPLPTIPATWDITSDSLAATVAVVSDRPLALVKSVPPPMSMETLADFATSGWVDAYFPIAASNVTAIHWVAPEGGSLTRCPDAMFQPGLPVPG